MIAKILIKEQPVSNYQFEQLQKTCTSIRKKVPADYYVYNLPEGVTKESAQLEAFDKESEAYIHGGYDSHIVDVPLLMNSCPFVKFEVLETVMTTQSSTPEILIHKFYEMSERLNHSVDTFNERCNVSIGGNTLIQFNSVKVETDFCTEALQMELNDGWRIIAVCVQPDGRRPDYVLGKTEI